MPRVKAWLSDWRAAALLVVAGVLCGCLGSTDPSTRIDESTRQRLGTALGAEFPDILEKHVKSNPALTPRELLGALDIYGFYVVTAPDKEHIEFLKAARTWAAPQSGGPGACPASPYAWEQQSLWEMIDLYVAGKRNPTRRSVDTPADIMAFRAAVADPQRTQALEDFMRGGITPNDPAARCRLLYDWYDTLLRLPPDQAVRLSIYRPTWFVASDL